MSGKLHAPTALPRRNNTVPIEYETGWAPKTVWTFWRTGRSFAPTGIRSPDRPARNLIAVFRENITNCVQQGLSWQAKCFSVSQDIPLIYETRGLITVVRRDRHVSLSWARSVQFKPPSPPSYFLKIHFNIIFPSTPRSSKWSISFRVPYQNPVFTSPVSLTCSTPPPVLFFVIWSPNINHEVHTMEISPGLSLFQISYLTQHLIPKYPQPMFFLMRETKFRTHVKPQAELQFCQI